MSIGFSTRGRIGRKSYIISSLVITLLTYAAAVVLALGVGESRDKLATANVIAVVIAVLGLVAQLCVSARRLHDLGKPGWHCLLFLIPLYNIYLSFVLALTRGTDGSNQYGPNPLAA